ncbi:hypothetical protein [Blastomonas sp.]|uniref:hypothetical protein n=1 Tax=Blastomonas sp. TaxID=1909299 RepID=UPI0035936605
MFGYKSRISIDRRFGFIRKASVTSAADSDGRQLRRVIDPANTPADVWADSVYRSQKNEASLSRNILTSRIHRRKPKGKPVPEHIVRVAAAKSANRARIEPPAPTNGTANRADKSWMLRESSLGFYAGNYVSKPFHRKGLEPRNRPGCATYLKALPQV